MDNKGAVKNLFQWNNKGLFDIFNDISDHFTLVQLEIQMVISTTLLVSQNFASMIQIIKAPFLW